jgi:ubiquinone/menaquinone biosynthesis C-methylase UbiE
VNETNRAAFRQFEHEGWQKVAARYNDSFAPVTTQSIGPLLDAAHVRNGTKLLDVACGPGYVTAAAAARGASALGVDFSSEMVLEARRRYPGLQFTEGDAEALTLPSAAFDEVVFNFGMLHFAQPERAIAEAYRVLRRSGRVAFTVWAPPEKTLGFGIVLNAIQKYGDLNVPIPPGPPFFRFSASEESERFLTNAGFVNPIVREVPQTWKLSSADELFNVMYYASVRNAALLHAQKPEVLEFIRTEVRRQVELYASELPMPAMLYSAEHA